MTDQTDAVVAEMPADGVEIVDIVVDALFDLRSIGDMVRPAAISRIAKDQRPTIGQPRKRIRQIHTIRDDHGIGPVSHYLREQAHTIVRRDMFLTWFHRSDPLNR